MAEAAPQDPSALELCLLGEQIDAARGDSAIIIRTFDALLTAGAHAGEPLWRMPLRCRTAGVCTAPPHTKTWSAEIGAVTAIEFLA